MRILKSTMTLTLVLLLMTSLIVLVNVPDAAALPQPNDVKVTNVHVSTFSVSWTTTEKTEGYLVYGTSPEGVTTYRVNDTQGANHLGYIHYCNVKGLLPNTTYYFKIASGAGAVLYPSEEEPYSVTTFENELTPDTSKIISRYGYVKNSMNSPVGGIIIYYNITHDGETSMLMSNFTEESGWFILEPSSARAADGSEFTWEIGDTINMYIEANPQGQNETSITLPGGSALESIGEFIIPLSFTLSGGSVTPTTGDTETEFNFTVTFTAADNVEPDNLWVYVNEHAYGMQETDPGDNDVTDGKEYFYQTTIDEVGSPSYYFKVKRGDINVDTDSSGDNEGSFTVTQASEDDGEDDELPLLPIMFAIVIIIIIILAVVMMKRKK